MPKNADHKNGPDLSYETKLRASGYRFIAGIDEAGRGPLAGPVIVAACILDPEQRIEGLNDSKKLTARARDRLYDEIRQKALSYSIEAASVEEIQELNILTATKEAARRALLRLDPAADMVLIDAFEIPALGIEQQGIIKGDSLSSSIAAASILAKVSRDRHMAKLAEHYPNYGFDKHKGYGTKAHYEALDRFGPCPEHRELFLRSWRKKNKSGSEVKG